WQFLGPLALAFAPLLMLEVRNTPSWRTALTVWVVGAIGIGATSGMTRFLLPVLPIAIATVLAGVAYLKPDGWKFTRYAAIGTTCCFLFVGAAGLLVYNRSAILEAVGVTPGEEYLRQHAPEYEKTEFINEVL